MEEDVPPELPLEVLVYVLTFLHAADRKEASLVCRSWYAASQDLRFQKDVTFSFPASTAALALVGRLARRRCCSLRISQLDGFSVSRLLLLQVGEGLGPRLEGLALPGSSITEASLLALLPRLTALRRLDLRGLDSLFMSGAFLSREEHRRQVRSALSGLEELDLSDLRYLSDLTFTRLTGCTPRLRRLALAGCHIAFEFDPYGGRPTGAGEDSSALLSLRNLRRLLVEQRATLRGLDLSRTAITPESLRVIAQVDGLVLEELRLQGCRELTDRSVEVLLQQQRSLHRLDVSGCTELSSRSVQAAARGLQALTDLSLSRDWRITERGQPRNAWFGSDQVVRFLELQRLSLCMLPELSDAGLAAVGRSCRSLTSLELSHCPGISDSGVAQAAPFLQRLQHLQLACCSNITDRTLHLLMQHCRRLKTLDVSRCKNISMTTVDLLQSQLPFLENVHHKLICAADPTLTD
ncbi:uncharacterized F-box/LRR-repeat protein C02F5.7 [Poecilia reticulata]|uniref:uncharacterized F-box/LRR-repeat protein C02F5.7 n=1 Tax=Poecilia reticulata TaxID=8081 RepID=UPI0007EA3222|nr:PREDICTED: uncharacterized F-box/LRR-repeat protein C02F5.7 [Poecilia reticulata]